MSVIRKFILMIFSIALWVLPQNVLADFYVIPFGPNIGTEIKSLPYTIENEGFYYLKKNLVVGNTYAAALTINADNVTLDLLGNMIKGPGKTSNVLNVGISVVGHQGIEIRNGVLTEFGGYGIYSDSASQNLRIFNMRVSNNGKSGIYLAGEGHMVKGCTSMHNALYGIYVAMSSSVQESIAIYNDSDGIRFGSGNNVSDNLSNNNGGHGINMGNGNVVKNNACYHNQFNGIYAIAYNVVSNNTAIYNNQSSGGYTNITSSTPVTYDNNYPTP